MRESVLLERTINIVKDQFYYDVMNGLSSTKKMLHPKYFYDKKGSEFFDKICDLEEYYPYNAELSLLPRVARDMSELFCDQYALVEFGAGSLLKVKPLLSEIKGIKQFIPIDISGEHLRKSCSELAAQFPALDIIPIEGDFSRPLDLNVDNKLKNIGFFPGSTIGNFTPTEAGGFLKNLCHTIGRDNYLLIGVDTKKSPKILHSAYNDRSEVTAKFNLNILDRINRHFDGPLDVAKFEHYAYYNTAKGCIEMHLVCLEDHSIYLDDVFISFDKGESIHTESSYKYSPKEFKALAKSSEWEIEHYWLAEDNMFAMYLLKNNF